MAAGELIPVTLLTGFLGSGKTTILAHILGAPEFARTLAIVNEFGEVGIDHDLIEASSDDTVLLANGCLCCTIRGNLVDTLTDALRQVEEGRLGAFDRVVVETSGMADPLPLLGFVFGVPEIARRFRLEAVVCVLDPCEGGAQMRRHEEAVSQVVSADRIVISKTDIASEDAVAETAAAARRLNETAEIRLSAPATLSPALVLAPPEGTAFAAGGEAGADPGAHHHGHGHDDEDEAGGSHPGIVAASYRFDRPIAADQFHRLEAGLAGLLDERTLRVKAILPVEGEGVARVLHAVGARLSPPARLEAVREEGSLVVIARHRALDDFDALMTGLGGRKLIVV